VHSGPGKDGSLLESEDCCCHIDPLNVQRCAILESVGVVVVKGCRKERRGHHIPSPLDNLEAVGIVARTERLGGLHRCLGVEFLQKAVVGCLSLRRKVVADYLGLLHKKAAG